MFNVSSKESKCTFTVCTVHEVMRTIRASEGMIVSQQGAHAFQIAQHLGLNKSMLLLVNAVAQ